MRHFFTDKLPLVLTYDHHNAFEMEKKNQQSRDYQMVLNVFVIYEVGTKLTASCFLLKALWLCKLR